MAFHELLVLRSGAPGLPGPYLQENMAPYRLLDGIKGSSPNIAMAIGGRTKSRVLGLDEPRDYAVRLRLLAPDTILADCDLHLQPLCSAPRIRGGPRPGHYKYHVLEDFTDNDTMQIALNVYCDALSHFCDVVLFFVADFGGMMETVRFFSAWIMRAKRRTYHSRSRIFIVPAEDVPWDERRFEFFLSAELLSEMQGCHRKCPRTLADVRDIITQYLEIGVTDGADDMSRLLISQIYRGAEMRSTMGTKYSAIHTKALLQASIAHLPKCRISPFNPVAAARLSNPVPERIGEHLLEVMTAFQSVDSDCTELVASALAMNAFPPGMHGEFSCKK
ncbi:hypothetical protein E5D57_001642 [Metarhizium anisopliae]|nr:hypothetical protein E5D57_013809 [Metarhizium anisopliae]KAF5137863.1 hypothetical protein E5D57_001642 [Metarhizium anisopliae]